MDMRGISVEAFTEELASPAAVPGGGGASALVSAIGIALGDMVGELTVGKKKYADVEEEIRALMERAQELRMRLLACIEQDAAAFEPLSKAYGLPKDTPGREEYLETCLRDAAQAPLDILTLTGEAIDILYDFSQKGSRLVLSDAATGAMICHGAMCGAAMNVRVNTRLMKDREYAARINARVGEILAAGLPKAEKIYSEVMELVG